MELKDLIGKHLLSGVQFGTYDESSTIDFILDDQIISVVEDSEDGYRSSMSDIILNREDIVITNKFSPVEVIGELDEDVVSFIDIITRKIVLSVGTDYTDSWYPCFIGEWVPENLCLNQNNNSVDIKIIRE